MPKHDSLTPKAIANRIKAKGLQKLRWYCQMCQKQCRDENGFKCHTMSESHQRQLLLFAENPDKYIDHFSQEFMESFIELLRRRFGTKRIHANQVYQEFIADRNHLHMNSTQWETLTELVKWLGREGHCNVDQTEKGWFIAYIDRDPETIKRQEAVAKKEKMDLDDDERMAKFLQKQIEKGKREQTKSNEEPVFTEIKPDSKVEFSLKPVIKKEVPILAKNRENPLTKAQTPSSSSKDKPRENSTKASATKRKYSALDDLIEEQETVKEKMNRKRYWLVPGLIVKIVAKKLGAAYFKKKAVVQKVQDKYVGIVKVIETGDILKIDQKHLQTVLPAVGRKLVVVNGAYRGLEATLAGIDPGRFCLSVEICSGPLRGRKVDNIQYEDVCKIHSKT